MLIVSQDKYNVLNFNNTVNIGVEEITTLSDVVQISAQTNGNTIVLGRYETKEKAKEILQEIIETYVITERYKLENPLTQIELAMKGVFVYEMPKESDRCELQ